MRTKDDLCLLCQAEKADKTNSHIIPYFMTKRMLIDGSKRTVYGFDTSNMHKPPPKAQDTPKVDYMLCSECEAYFSVLETYFANKIHNRIRDKKFLHEFEIINNQGKYLIMVSKVVNPLAVFLLMYSIVWRCHVVTHKLSADFNLDPQHALLLRKELLKFKSVKQNDLLTLLKNKESSFIYFPFSIITAATATDISKNFVFVNPYTLNPVSILAAEYLLHLSFDKEADPILNDSRKPFRLIVIREEGWDDMLTGVVNLLADETRDSLNKSGRKYYNS